MACLTLCGETLTVLAVQLIPLSCLNGKLMAILCGHTSDVLAEQVGGGHELGDDRYSLDQNAGDNEDSQGHNGDHHQGGDGLLLLAGSHHCQEVCMLTANTHVPRVAAEGERNVSLLLTEDIGQAPESTGILCDWRHRCGAVCPPSCQGAAC